MSTTTTNYGLVKPELTDAADITAMNGNWDTIDAELKNNKSYVDQKIQEIPTPDVSGQINSHNTDTSSHSDIRTAVNEAKQSATKALTDAKSYTDSKIASIPTPDVSGQINDHNSDPNAHADIRAGAFPIEGGTVTGTEIGINNNRGKIFASGSVTRLYATENPADTDNQRYLNLYSQFFKEDISESLKVTERIDGVDKSYKIYGEHNITSGTTDLTAGTSELPSGHIYLVYE